jgi:hypothetical protein
MKRAMLVMGLLVVGAMLVASQAWGGPVSGAIFTTTADGSEVNFNIYSNKTDVYLNGGPGPGAPTIAAGLPDGVYVFMVTEPSGKTLLSQDIAACRRFTVSGGIMTMLVTSNPTCGAPHLTGTDEEPGAITVQLMPYANTPNNGGEYKAWATPVADYLCPLTAIDCGLGKHGFQDGFSKTDNFKVKVSAVREIDTRFLDTNNGGAFIDGLGITWIDTLGNSNNKWSYYNLTLDVIHEAHVEAPENGTHQIVIQNQTGCTVDTVYLNGTALPNSGPQTVLVKVSPSDKNVTLRVDVNCN